MEVSEVHPNLVRAAGQQADLEQAVARCELEATELADGGAPRGMDRHPLPAPWIAADWRLDARPLIGDLADHDRHVRAAHGSGGQLLRQRAVSLVIARH